MCSIYVRIQDILFIWVLAQDTDLAATVEHMHL